MKSNKGVTITSLVVYIALIFVILAILMRITTRFSNNMEDVADVAFETEFNKLNLYLLDETKKMGNGIQRITEGTTLAFTNGNRYFYNVEDKSIYLNDTIKICENIEKCLFEQKTAENGKDILSLTITIDNITKTFEYVVASVEQQGAEVVMDDYLWGSSIISYYLKVGDYVAYTPDEGLYKVAEGTKGTGYTTIQSFTTDKLKWRIFSIDEQTGEIELISETVAQSSTPLYLQGADGYNHGVDILNDLCDKIYSKTVDGTKVATARSINIEDINNKTTFNPTDYSTYGGTPYTPSNKQYPNIYSLELGSTAEGLSVNKKLLRESERIETGKVNGEGVTEYTKYTGSSTASTLYSTYTYYQYFPEESLKEDMGINTVPVGLIKADLGYWIASRYAASSSERVGFGMRIINENGEVNRDYMFRSNGDTNGPSYAIRPIVTLSAIDLLDFSLGDGSKEKPWGMK